MIDFMPSIYSFLIIILSSFLVKLFVGLVYVNNFNSENFIKKLWYTLLNTIQQNLEMIKVAKFSTSSVAESFLAITLIFISIFSVYIGYFEDILNIKESVWIYTILIFSGVFIHTLYSLYRNTIYQLDEIIKNRIESILIVFILMSTQFFFSVDGWLNIALTAIGIIVSSNVLYKTYNLENINSNQLFTNNLNIIWGIGSINLLVIYFLRVSGLYFLNNAMILEPLISLAILFCNIFIQRQVSNLRVKSNSENNGLMIFILVFVIIRMLCWIY